MRYLLLLLASLFAINSFAIESIESELLRQLSTAKGEERLVILHKLQQTFLYESKDKYYNDLLLEEAQRQQNSKYQAIAHTSRTVHHYRDFDTDSVFYYAEIAEKFDKEHGEYRSLFQVKEIVIYRYIGQGHFSLALKKALKMNEQALLIDNPRVHVLSYMTLAHVYWGTGQLDEVILNAQKALDTCIEEDNEAPYNKIQCYDLMARAYTSNGDIANVMLYTDSLCNQVEYVRENFPVFNLTEFEQMCILHTAYYYIETNQLEDAWRAMEKGDSLLGDGSLPHFYYQTYINKMRYYRAVGNYDKCWEYYQKSFDYCKGNNLEGEIRSLLRFRANTLNMAMEYDKSSQTYDELLSHVDSVNRERLAYEIGQLQTDYELDKKEIEIVHRDKRYNLTIQFIVVLSSLLLLLIILAVIAFKKLRSIRKKNYLLFNQISELSNAKKELVEFKDMLQDNLPGLTESKDELSDDSLYAKIDNYMREEKPYILPEYGRRELIIDMNTNEAYLAKAIKKGTKLTIHEYINRWRMDYAKQLLLENTNLTIEAVAGDAGFTSIRSFYRLFKEQHGMSPAEFRNYAVNNNQ